MADNIADTLNSIQTAFEEFKSTNDANLSQRDVLLEEKTDRINTAITNLEAQLREVEKKAQRPPIDTGIAEDGERKAFNAFLRTGEIKAMSASVSAEGGYLIPKIIDSAIAQSTTDVSPIRSIARVVSTTTSDFHIPFNLGGTGSAWVAEKASRGETSAPQIADIAVPSGEIYANPLVTQVLIEDSQFDVEAFVAAEVAKEFARGEGAAFIAGDGINKPKGFTAYTTAATADATRAFGTLQHIASGTSATLPGADKLIDVVHALKAGYRAGATWVMPKAVLGEFRKLKDATNGYLWQPGLQAGQPSTLLGYPVLEAEDMPAVAANSLSVAFGNFAAGYVIVDRIGTSILRDPFSNKPYVAFYTRKRVGGAVVDSSAIKLVKLSAS